MTTSLSVFEGNGGSTSNGSNPASVPDGRLGLNVCGVSRSEHKLFKNSFTNWYKTSQNIKKLHKTDSKTLPLIVYNE